MNKTFGYQAFDPLDNGLGQVLEKFADSAVFPAPCVLYHKRLLKFVPLVYSTLILKLSTLFQVNGVVNVTPYQEPTTLLKEMGPLYTSVALLMIVVAQSWLVVVDVAEVFSM